MSSISKIALKLTLILLGLFVIFLSVDFGLGGFKSLGWQGTVNFLQITDEARYGVQDSNFRFFAGSFAVIGIFLIYSIRNLKKYQSSLNLIFLLVFVGGMARLTSGNLDSLLSQSIAPAIFVETVCMVILYYWLAYEVRLTA